MVPIYQKRAFLYRAFRERGKNFSIPPGGMRKAACRCPTLPPAAEGCALSFLPVGLLSPPVPFPDPSLSEASRFQRCRPDGAPRRPRAI